MSGKVVNKRQLQEKYGLAVDKDVMLIGMVSRLTNQKGFDLVGICDGGDAFHHECTVYSAGHRRAAVRGDV